MTGVNDTEARRRVTIVNEKGLHARAAFKFVELAGGYDAKITVVRKDTEVPGSSILGLMMLAAARKSTLEIRASGPEARQAVDALAALVANGFYE